MKKIALFVLCLYGLVFAEGYGFWFSASAIWGQGNFGGFYRFNESNSISFNEYFILDWRDLSIDYNSEVITSKYNNLSYGVAFKKDRRIDADREISPFIGYFNKTELFDIYQGLEYRYNNLLLIDDYYRYLFSISYDFAHYQEYDFYVKSSTFFNINGTYLEKQFFYLGIKRVDENATLTLYIIPYKYGDLGQSWDDISFIGGSFQYRF